MDTSIPLKRCTGPCGDEYPPTTEFFHVQKATRDGLTYYCKQCIKAQRSQYVKAHKEQKAEYNKQYREAHKEALNEYNRQWYYSHRQYALKKVKQWGHTHRVQANTTHKRHRDAHPGYDNERGKHYRKAHREQINAYHRQYSKREIAKEQDRARSHKRRARKRGNGGTYTAQQIREQYNHQKGKCWYCQQPVSFSKKHIDHVIPLSRGGSNDISNIVIACVHCNLKKSNRPPHEFPEGGRLL